MNAFDMISEPVLFTEQLCERSCRVLQCVDLIPSLADALLAQDDEKMTALHVQVSALRVEVDQGKLSLYEQIRHMHFHRAGGYAFSQYLACQDKVAGAAEEFASLLVLRKTAVPLELHADFRAFVAQVVQVSRRMRSLTEGPCTDTQTVCADTERQNMLGIIRGVIDDNRQARRLEMQLAQHVYRLEKQVDPVTILFLDKCFAALHAVADSTAQTAEHLRLMMR
jgi:uncharacterized protein Yka (UPF0111/DUF47 family)